MERFTANIAGVEVNLELASLPAESLAFVIEYGIRQYVQDGAAVSKVHTSKEKKGVEKTEEEIEAEKKEGVEERVLNLRTGTFTRRGPAAPKMTPEERERDAIVMDGLEKMAKTIGKTLPTKTGKNADPELLQTYKTRWYEKHKDSIDKEVARRLKVKIAEPEDVSDIFA